jgi:hypothetical protein
MLAIVHHHQDDAVWSWQKKKVVVTSRVGWWHVNCAVHLGMALDFAMLLKPWLENLRPRRSLSDMRYSDSGKHYPG